MKGRPMSLNHGLVKLSSKQSLITRMGVGIALGITVIVLELIDHYQPGVSFLSDIHFIREVILYGFFLPIGGTILLTLLERTNAERRGSADLLNKREAFEGRLNETIGWEQLIRVIVQFPQTILPVMGSTLLIYNPNNKRLEVVAEWRADGVTSIQPNPFIMDICFSCQINDLSSLGKLVPSDYVVDNRVLPKSRRFCLPLVKSGRRLGILHLDFLPEYRLSSNNFQLLNGIAPIITLAIERGLLKQSVVHQADLNEVDKQRIAQEMHDTLAQNIAYLRLKLDQFSTDNVLGEIEIIREDLARMRDIADEAYQQVRGTLDKLHISSMKELPDLVQEHVQRMQETTAISIQYATRGLPYPLSPQVKRQVFFIIKEALSNAITHSSAKNIYLSVAWDGPEIIATISDDGRGFQTQAVRDGHYGLEIMRERAEDIFGNIEITSKENTGTQVTLRVPHLRTQENEWPECAPIETTLGTLVD
jgi:nitrate/nitrite-specific signal transduction histidine kinase